MQPKRDQTKPIPKHLQDGFYTCMWELAMTGRFYRKVDPSSFAVADSFFHSFGSGKRASVLVSQRHGLLVLWSTAAALRFNELAHLKLTDVDTHESTVYVRREQLVGWQELSRLEARKTAHFACSACGETWNKSERCEANRASRLPHNSRRLMRLAKWSVRHQRAIH